MKMCVWVGNLFWGMRFTRSLPYCFVNRRLVLFPCNMANFVQSHTAITSIVFYAIHTNFCHSERSEESKNLKNMDCHEVVPTSRNDKKQKQRKDK